jgi:hypothetical protein
MAMSDNGAHQQCHQRCNVIPIINGTRMRNMGILESIDDGIVEQEVNADTMTGA